MLLFAFLGGGPSANSQQPASGSKAGLVDY